jgi:glutathione S-transferase
LFTVTNWAKALKVDLSKLGNLLKFQERVAARPAVRAAMQAEGWVGELTAGVSGGWRGV